MNRKKVIKMVGSVCTTMLVIIFVVALLTSCQTTEQMSTAAKKESLVMLAEKLASDLQQVDVNASVQLVVSDNRVEFVMVTVKGETEIRSTIAAYKSIDDAFRVNMDDGFILSDGSVLGWEPEDSVDE